MEVEQDPNPIPIPPGASGGGPSPAELAARLFTLDSAVLRQFAGEFGKRLRSGDISEDCAKDIVALGIAPDDWADKLDNLSILMGLGSTDPYYTALPVGSPERAVAQQRNLTIGSNFSPTSGTVAISSVNDNRVWIDPMKINPGNRPAASALIAHEALHKFGLLDPQIQQKLGIPVSPASVNISEKLTSDCFPGPTAILLP